jgi:hypothetical protein
MATGRLKELALATAGAGAALETALTLVRSSDAARIEADPEWEPCPRRCCIAGCGSSP